MDTNYLNRECVNCGYTCLSIQDVRNCPRCGATVVCISPTVTPNNQREDDVN